MHHDKRVIRRDEATTGDRGEALLAHGDRVGLRVWQHEPAGEQSPRHTNDYEYVAYLTDGAMRVQIGDDEPADVQAGDSYVVPAGTPYSFEVLESAVVVEAVSPPDALEP